MDNHHARTETRRPTPAAPKPEGTDRQATPEQRELLELQRIAGNRAVADALASVQRHSLNPEEME